MPMTIEKTEAVEDMAQTEKMEKMEKTETMGLLAQTEKMESMGQMATISKKEMIQLVEKMEKTETMVRMVQMATICQTKMEKIAKIRLRLSRSLLPVAHTFTKLGRRRRHFLRRSLLLVALALALRQQAWMSLRRILGTHFSVTMGRLAPPHVCQLEDLNSLD